MPGSKNLDEQKRPKTKRADTVGAYNPVNMAGKKAEPLEEPTQEDASVEDSYNPVNMAGKKAALPEK